MNIKVSQSIIILKLNNIKNRLKCVTRLCSSRSSVVFHHLDNGHY